MPLVMAMFLHKLHIINVVIVIYNKFYHYNTTYESYETDYIYNIYCKLQFTFLILYRGKFKELTNLNAKIPPMQLIALGGILKN